MNISEFIKSWKAILVFVILAFGIGLGMHTHTDEFILFSNLEYEQPNFYLNEFTNGYQAFIKIFPGNFQVHLPFNYLGNIRGFCFIPFTNYYRLRSPNFAIHFYHSLVYSCYLFKALNLRGKNYGFFYFLSRCTSQSCMTAGRSIWP